MTTNFFRINNPFDPDNAGSAAVRAKGVTVVIPKGTVIRTTHPSDGPVKVSKRTHTVKVHHVNWGYIGRDARDEGRVYYPTITWAGAGGYWCDVQVTPELAAANGVELPELPVPDENGRVDNWRLEVIPSYDDGYTDRWAVPNA